MFCVRSRLLEFHSTFFVIFQSSNLSTQSHQPSKTLGSSSAGD